MADFELVLAQQREEFLHKIPLACQPDHAIVDHTEGLRADQCRPRTHVAGDLHLPGGLQRPQLQ